MRSKSTFRRLLLGFAGLALPVALALVTAGITRASQDAPAGVLPGVSASTPDAAASPPVRTTPSAGDHQGDRQGSKHGGSGGTTSGSSTSPTGGGSGRCSEPEHSTDPTCTSGSEDGGSGSGSGSGDSSPTPDSGSGDSSPTPDSGSGDSSPSPDSGSGGSGSGSGGDDAAAQLAG